MFNVSYTDRPETVGQHKSRKGRQSSDSTGPCRRSSLRNSGSSDSCQQQPSFFNIFNGKRKSGLQRSSSHSRTSSSPQEDSAKQSRRQSSYTSQFESSPKDIPGATASTSCTVVKGFFPGEVSYNTDTEKSSPTEGALSYLYVKTPMLTGIASIFSTWTGRSARTTSSWGSAPDANSISHVMQPQSRSSIVTQSTGMTISSQESGKEAEQLATAVRISSVSSSPVQVGNLPSKA